MAHGTSPLCTSVRSLRNLHSLGPSALSCVDSIETCTSVYDLHLSLFPLYRFDFCSPNMNTRDGDPPENLGQVKKKS